MTRKEQTEYIRNHPELYLTEAPKRSGGFPTYICPLCGNGQGQDGDGITTKDGIHFSCWRCGEKSGLTNVDIIDIIALENQITPGTKQAFDKAIEEYTNRGYLTPEAVSHYRPKPKPTPKKNIPIDEIENALLNMYTDENMDKASEYLQGRGISPKTAYRLMFTFTNHNNRPGLVIPSEARIESKDRKTYSIRYTDIKPNEKDKKKPKSHNADDGPIGTFNSKAVFQAVHPVFICEGAIDASSIIELGGEAVAYNGTGQSYLLDYIKEGKCENYIIVPDNDKPGQEKAESLQRAIELMGKNVALMKLNAKYHDVNVNLIENREELKMAIDKAIQENTLPDIVEKYKLKNTSADFKTYISIPHPAIATGIKEIDEILDGGLRNQWMYLIGGAPGTFKTTLALQIADNIASRNHPVVFFSLEMSKHFINAKSISRVSYKLARERCKRALKPMEIINYYNLSDEDKEMADTAMFNYFASVGDDLSILEGDKTIGEIIAYVDKYVELTKKRPIVIIDYLQYIRPNPSDKIASDKQRTDIVSKELTELKKRIDAPIIVLSSLSRGNKDKDNYENPDMSALKESGQLEYDADAVMTLAKDAKGIKLGLPKIRFGKTFKSSDTNNHHILKTEHEAYSELE